MAVSRRLLPSLYAPHPEEAKRMFAQNSEICLPIQEKKKKGNGSGKYTDRLCYYFPLIAFVDV
jgi:hypothetical protein